MKTLLLIDLQNDFCPGGALAVDEGNLLIPIANALMPKFDLVLATQDWHPATHGSFAANHPWRRPGQVIDLNGLPRYFGPFTVYRKVLELNLSKVLIQMAFTKCLSKVPTLKLTVTVVFLTTATAKPPAWVITSKHKV